MATSRTLSFVFALAVTGCMHNLSSMPEDHVEVMELDEATVAKHETAAGEGQRQSRASLEDVRVAEPERAEREAPAAEEARPVAGLMAEPSPAPMSRPMEGASAVRGGMAKRSRPAADAVASRPAPPPVVQHVAPAEYLTDYGINRFTDPRKDAFSTFAVDVDTASYTMSRRMIDSGYIPAAAGIRVEEFINYFPYDYSRPTRGTPFTVDFEASPSPYSANNHIVRVGVQGKKVAQDIRKSVHLTFLVDVSGSMRAQDKIGLLKKTLVMLTEELEDGDTIAIATYAGRTDVVLPPTPVSRKDDIIRSLHALTAGGSTAMGAGIDLAYGLADRSLVPGAVNRVIVCSDGDANVGQTSHEALSAKIRGYAEKGITLTTVGFGAGNYNDTMMERLANDGDGNYFYIDSEREARRVFVDDLTGTMEVIAKDVKIQVEWDAEDVLAYRLIGYENRDVADRDFRNDAVDAGEIGSGHQVTPLYEVSLVDHPRGSIATVRVRNKAPGPDAPAVERSFNLSAESIHGSFAASSRQFRVATAAAGFAEVLRSSPFMREVGLSEVADIARGAQRAEYPEDAELVRLIERAASLRGEQSFVRR